MSSRNAWLVLAALGVLVYANTLAGPFVHDDIVFILQNPQVRTFSDISQVFTRSSITPPDLVFANPYYRPLLDVLYKIEFLFFGAAPAGYHAVNIFFHISNAILVFSLLARLSGRERLSRGAAVLFLVHPVNTEAVACISGVSNLLSTFFCLAAFLLYLKITEENGTLELWQEAVWYAGALLLFGLGLLTKEQAIVLPALFVLYEFCFSKTIATRRTGWRLRLTGSFIVAGGYLLWRKMALGNFTTSLAANPGEFFLRLKALPGMLFEHLRVLVIPYDLHYYRSYDILSPWIVPFLLSLAAAGCFWAAYAFVPVRDKRLVGFGLGWFLIALSPTMVIPLIHEYSWVALFEHFLYLPMVGLLLAVFVIAGHLADRCLHKEATAVKRSVFAAVILAAVLVTIGQNRVWAGEVPLFEQAVRYEKKLGRVRLLLGKAYLLNGEIPAARREFRVSHDIMAAYLAKIRDERLRPFYEGFVRESVQGLAACDNYAALAAVRLEKWDEAVVHFQAALAWTPNDPAAMANLAVGYIHQGQLTKAEELLRRAVALDPGSAPARNNLRLLLEQKDQVRP